MNPLKWLALLCAAFVFDAGAAQWLDYDPPATYAKTVSKTGYTITMSDGVKLAATVIFPADAAGNIPSTPLPVILIQDSYNKAVPGLNSSGSYFVQHGYIQVITDVRGTGNSQGSWQAFDAREQQDYGEVIDWISAQPWSDDRIGTYGASYLAIDQLFTAQWQKPQHKAVFAIVPMADGYRDIVFTGGNVNITFIPLWFGLIAALGEMPTDPKLAPAMILSTLLGHLQSSTTIFQVPLVLKAALGAPDAAYDGPFWRQRSPIEIAPKIKTPTFIVGGTHDLFQRGEPLLYNQLKTHVPAKLLIGPWSHIEASLGMGLPRDGVPTLEHIALQWFDRYVKGMSGNGAESQPKVTQWYYGQNRFVPVADWPHPQAVAGRLFLHRGGALTGAAPTTAELPTLLPQQPLDGLCSLSLAQWTAGALSGGTLAAAYPSNPAFFDAVSKLQIPCVADNRLDEALFEQTFTTPPVTQDTAINGPIEADIWVSTTAANGVVSVFVTDVDPNGKSVPITNGMQSLALRAVNDAGPATYKLADSKKLLQRLRPWHPFTQASVLPVPFGQPVLVPVEIFPSSFVIAKGHRLRIAVGPSDLAQGMPPVPALLQGGLGIMKIHTDAQHQSSVALPFVPVP